MSRNGAAGVFFVRLAADDQHFRLNVWKLSFSHNDTEKKEMAQTEEKGFTRKINRYDLTATNEQWWLSW